jgi:hypothetical protein
MHLLETLTFRITQEQDLSHPWLLTEMVNFTSG